MLSRLLLTTVLFTLLSPVWSRDHPNGTLIVDQEPREGRYLTIQAAIDALSINDTKPQNIYIRAGYYNESVHVPARKASLTIKGATKKKNRDDYSYHGNLVTIGRNASQADGYTNDQTATLSVHMNNFTLHNVNIKNEFMRGGSQALALSAVGDQHMYLGSNFTGYIDTIGVEGGDQFFAGSYIEGAIDFLFGRTGNAWFQNCDIAVTSRKHGWIIASGRENDGRQGAFIINESNIYGKPGVDVKNGSVYLGRPWGHEALGAVQSSSLSEIVNSTGWDLWRANDDHIEKARFYEFNNSGPGADGDRVAFARRMNKPIKIQQIFNSTDWIDPEYYVV